jgi:hypothetical protein
MQLVFVALTPKDLKPANISCLFFLRADSAHISIYKISQREHMRCNIAYGNHRGTVFHLEHNIARKLDIVLKILNI